MSAYYLQQSEALQGGLGRPLPRLLLASAAAYSLRLPGYDSLKGEHPLMVRAGGVYKVIRYVALMLLLHMLLQQRLIILGVQHIAISDKSDKELADLFGVKEYAVKKTREQAKMFKKKSLKFAVDFLSDSDYKVKSGVADADENMWLSFFEIVNKA